jgi:hypothetical protein
MDIAPLALVFFVCWFRTRRILEHGWGYQIEVNHLRMHSPSAQVHSRVFCGWPPAPLWRALLTPHGGHRGRLRELDQARLLERVRQEREQGLIGTEDFPDQHDAQ